MEHRGPLTGGRSNTVGMRTGDAGKEAEGGGGGSRERARREGRATSTLKQEDWNKRLAWTAREGKAAASRRWRRNGEETGGGGAQSAADAGMEPDPASHTIFLHLGTQPPFVAVRGPSSWFLCSRRFLLLRNALLLFIFLHSPPSSSLFSPPPPSTFCSLTSSPSVSVSNCSATLRRRLSRRPPLLCSRRWLDNFVNVTRDLTSRNVCSVGN